MKQMLKTKQRPLLLSTLVGTGLALAGYLRYSTKSFLPLNTHLATPWPPLSLEPSRFPCLDSLADRRSTKRVVVLHGLIGTLTPVLNFSVSPRGKLFCLSK